MQESDFVGVGGDLEPMTLLHAYAQGLFPMRVGDDGPLGWWSPDPRGIIPLDRFHASRSLRRSRRRYRTTLDECFEAVMRACGDPDRPGAWIDESFVVAYTRLHELGHAHSVEAWDVETGAFAGGVYGIALGGLFAAESMFHRQTDAGKIAVWDLVDRLRRGGGALLDVQWTTPHLRTLGAVDVPREHYLELLADAVTRPPVEFGP